MLTRTILAVVVYLILKLCCYAQLPVVPTALHSSGSGFPPGTHNVIAWYSSASLVTNASAVSPPSNGDNAATWGDLSGHNYTLIRTNPSPVQPIYTNTGGPNGAPFVFTTPIGGSFTAYGMKTVGSGAAIAQPNTYYFVASINPQEQTAASDVAIMNGYADQNGQISLHNSGSPPTNMVAYAGAPGATLNINTVFPTPIFAPNWCIWTFQFNGASSLIRTNGVQAVSGQNFGSLGMNGLTLFNFFNASGSAWMGLTEFIWDNNGSSSADMLLVEEYLATKYAIPNVP